MVKTQQIENTYECILAFKRTNRFPAPGQIIEMSQDAIDKFIKDIDETRDEYQRQYYPIRSKFSNMSGIQTFFNPTAFDKDIKATVPLVVEELIPGDNKKEPILAKCSIKMIDWPFDIKPEDQWFYVNTTYARVIELVHCNQEYTLSDTQPDYASTFGVKTKINDKQYYKLFHAIDQEQMPPQMHQFVLNYGLKEYSKVLLTVVKPETQQLNPVVKHDDVQLSKNHVADFMKKLHSIKDEDIDQDYDAEAANNEYVKALKGHPLHQYTKMIYANFLSAILVNDIILDEATENYLYYQVFDAMLRSKASNTTTVTLTKQDQTDAENIPD